MSNNANKIAKQLKFAWPLPEMVLAGEKDTTWRIDDDKNITVGDHLSLCRANGQEFAQAIVLWAKETTLGNLTAEDKARHEKFSSDEEMLQTYSRYYKIKVDYETKLKVIKLKLL